MHGHRERQHHGADALGEKERRRHRVPPFSACQNSARFNPAIE